MATIIRRDQHLSGEAFSFADLAQQRQKQTEQAQAEASRILAAAREEAERLKAAAQRAGAEQGQREGRAAGAEQGRAEGKAEALAEFRNANAHLLQTLKAGLAKLGEQHERLISTAECGMIQLALAIAERVCKRQCAASSEVAIANARRLLEMARHELDIELRVHPHDFAALEQAAPELAGIGDSAAHVAVIADPGLGVGDVVLQSKHGTLDASISTQLERIAAALVPESPLSLPAADAVGEAP